MKQLDNCPKCKNFFIKIEKKGLRYIEIAEFQNVSVNT